MDQPFIGACVGEKLSSTRPTTLDSEVAQILRAGFHGVEYISIKVYTQFFLWCFAMLMLDMRAFRLLVVGMTMP